MLTSGLNSEYRFNPYKENVVFILEIKFYVNLGINADSPLFDGNSIKKELRKRTVSLIRL